MKKLVLLTILVGFCFLLSSAGQCDEIEGKEKLQIGSSAELKSCRG